MKNHTVDYNANKCNHTGINVENFQQILLIFKEKENGLKKKHSLLIAEIEYDICF